MSQETYSILTNKGRAKEAAALADGKELIITHIAIGDGATVPSGGETQLYHEVDRKPVSSHGLVAGTTNTAYFSIFLGVTDGPYTIKEAGLFDIDGDLIAIAHYNPPINKPTPDSGQSMEGEVRIEIEFSNTANVIVKVDTSLRVPLQRLTACPWIPIKSDNISEPPNSPSIGDTYVIPYGASGTWFGHANELAEFTTAGWALIDAPDGHGVGLPNGTILHRKDKKYIPQIAMDVQSGKWLFAYAGGTANRLVVSLYPSQTLAVGMEIHVQIAMNNTGPVTLNLNYLGERPCTTSSGDTLNPNDLKAGSIVTFIYNGTNWTTILEGVRFLTAPTTLYVRTNGSDNNDGTADTPQKAFRTIQRAINIAQSRYISTAQKITISVAYGQYDGFELVGGASTIIEIIGNNDSRGKAEIKQTDPNKICVHVSRNSTVTLRNFSISGGDMAICASDRSLINIDTCSVGTCKSYQICAITNSNINITDKIDISGKCMSAFVATAGGTITATSMVTFTSHSNYSTATIWANNGTILASTAKFNTNGYNITGIRYIADLNGLIWTAGSGQYFIPGTINGRTEAGGLYA